MAVARPRSDQPMMEINTTPLIDVMLVLLIMIIITIPVATHITEWNAGSGPAKPELVDRTVNRVVVTADRRILWNGTMVSEQQLSSLLQYSLALPVEPQLQFQPQADASYELAAKVTYLIKSSGVTNFGFVGNERYSEFGKARN